MKTRRVLNSWHSVLDFLVSPEVAGVGEVSVAEGADEGPLSGVNVSMDFQLTLAHKALATQVAGVRPYSAVPGQVLSEVQL